MSSSTKTRHPTRQPPRLRASCDGCFIAKVKCTKNRPVCARCLSCGIDCRYSPSSRAGKPKSDANSSGAPSGAHGSTDLPAVSEVLDPGALVLSDMPGTPDDNDATSPSHQVPAWNTPPSSCDGNMSRSHSMSSDLAMLGMETSAPSPANAVPTADMYAAATSMPWTPPHDMTTPCPDLHGMSMYAGNGPSLSYDVALAAMGQSWVDPTNQDMLSYGPAPLTTTGSMAPVYFPSPVSTPIVQQATRPKPGASGASGGGSGTGGSCTCFTACLQSLHALHNASSPAVPAFDQVLSVNRKAVEGCANMLNCQRCMSRSGTHTAVMLLATVMGKITSFYKNASSHHFDPSSAAMVTGGYASIGAASHPSSLGISVGAYQLRGDDGKWLELEILARELRRLEEVYGRFKDVCADLCEDPYVSEAMVGYLGRTMESTLAVVQSRKAAIFGA